VSHSSVILDARCLILPPEHKFCGIVNKVVSGVTSLKEGDRVVASFQIACGECRFCRHGLASTCERTNGSRLQNAMYGNRTSGEVHRVLSCLSSSDGRIHCVFAGGQAE
jgi:threonine dehydrogenase-like Zn-dependent dehydrogenase